MPFVGHCFLDTGPQPIIIPHQPWRRMLDPKPQKLAKYAHLKSILRARVRNSVPRHVGIVQPLPRPRLESHLLSLISKVSNVVLTIMLIRIFTRFAA
jgi:hypothetical protein